MTINNPISDLPPLKDIHNRILDLRAQILYHNDLYYVKSDPEICDTDYDDLYRELLQLEAQYPEFYDAKSPTNMVGGKLIDKLGKVRHKFSINSLDKVYDKSAITDFFINAKSRAKNYSREEFSHGYIVEPKYDGLTLVLYYRDGVLRRVLTRGDSCYGNDVTHNAKVIDGIPKVLSYEVQNLIVRGEAIIPKSQFERLNAGRRKEEKPEFRTARNLVSGSIQQLDSTFIQDRGITFIPYEIQSDYDFYRDAISLHIYNKGKYSTFSMKLYEQTLKFLDKLGFNVNKDYLKFDTLDSLYNYCCCEEFYERMRNLPYDVDGFVIKLNSIKLRHQLNTGSTFPYWQLAYKMPQELYFSRLLDVEWGIGKTGAITPVAIFNTVRIDGTDVSRATLHNMSEISRLGIKIGNKIAIEKAGGIIPAIKKSIGDHDWKDRVYKDIIPPTSCPACGSSVIIKDGQIRCSDPDNCVGAFNRRLLYFVGKKGLNIDGFGDKLCKALCESRVSNLSDVFSLTVDDLKPIVGNKVASKIVDTINNIRSVSLSKFITLLQIPHIGQTSAKQLASHFGSIEKIMHASVSDIEKIDNFGPIASKSVYNYLRIQQVIDEISYLLSRLSIKEDNMSGKLSGTFCITGTLSKPRQYFESLVHMNGGILVNSVSKNLTYLIAGNDAGTKLEKAKELGIVILDEAKFMEMIK